MRGTEKIAWPPLVSDQFRIKSASFIPPMMPMAFVTPSSKAAMIAVVDSGWGGGVKFSNVEVETVLFTRCECLLWDQAGFHRLRRGGNPAFRSQAEEWIIFTDAIFER